VVQVEELTLETLGSVPFASKQNKTKQNPCLIAEFEF
jgi:hypothetical protein